MLNAFRDLLCSMLCWHNRPGPSNNHLVCELHSSYVTEVYVCGVDVIAQKVSA